MSEAHQTFGAEFVQLPSVTERLTFESEHQKRSSFSDIDSAVTLWIQSALRGNRIAEVVPAAKKSERDRVELTVGLSDDERSAVNDHFDASNQEKRGSWHLPKDEPISLGLMHTSHWRNQNERFFLSLASRESVSPSFANSPDAVALWTLEPLFEDLYMPLKLRSTFGLGKKSVEQQEKYWLAISPLYSALGIDDAPLDGFRIHSGWSTLTTEETIARKTRLVDAWREAPENAADRYRVYRIGELIDRYYSKAKGGKATRKQVLTKAHGRTLTAYFGGDWLEFLAYLGEQPHPNEEVVTQLPETKILVGSTEKTAAVASEVGVPAEDVEKMLASFWGQSDHQSPIDLRVSAMTRYWRAFDAAHAAQAPGMVPLWGFVDEGHAYVRSLEANGYAADSFRSKLEADLIREIENLWRTTALSKFPDRVVSEPFPHAAMAKAFGPALELWHGIGLTAWFICEGPYSRTDIGGMEEYYAKPLAELDRLGFPLDLQMFAELKKVRSKLKPERQKSSSRAMPEIGDFSITISTGSGERLKGFEKLRDVITAYRQRWENLYLADYLRRICEDELRTAGKEFSRSAAQRGKDPTLKMFAKDALPVAKNWFAGDLGKVYAAIGQSSPEIIRNELRLPDDVKRFVRDVFYRLGGEDFDDSNRMMRSSEEIERFHENRERFAHFSRLAEKSPLFVQTYEALGTRPSLKEFGRTNFAVSRDLSDEEVERQWIEYCDIVETVIDESASQTDRNTEALESQPDAVQSGPATVSPNPAAWHSDPTSAFEWRWWDGEKWSQHVSDGDAAPEGLPKRVEFRGVYYSSVLDDGTCDECRAADDGALRRFDDKSHTPAPHSGCTSSRGCCCAEVFVYLDEVASFGGYEWSTESQRLNELLGEP